MLFSSDSSEVITKGQLAVSQRTAKLLFISNETPLNVTSTMSISIRIELIGDTVKLIDIPQVEPSTIYTKLPFRKPNSPENTPPPSYYPTYAGLTPEQKWVYLNWLKDISKPINISFVFIYYYGLERHLLFGDFESAFNEIIYLRKNHSNKSFQSYSGSALLHSCVLRQRLDMLETLNQLGELVGHGNSKLLMSHKLGFDLTAASLMDISKLIRGISQRYIKSAPEMFEKNLSNLLSSKYGAPYFPFAHRYNINEIPKQSDLLFANISFPPEIRTPKLPNFLELHSFIDEVKELFDKAHEIVKLELKETRKK